MLTRAEECNSSHKKVWLSAAGFVLGATIWSTHFLGMVAFDGPIELGFNVWLTALSLGAGIFCSITLTFIGFSHRSKASLLFCGPLLAIAIGATHFLGLRALSPFEVISIDPYSTVYSLCLGATVATGAMIWFGRFRGKARILGTASLVVCAILSLHLTSMGGTQLLFAPDPSVVSSSLGRATIAAAVSILSGILIAVSLISVVVDRQLTDLRGFAEATFEGIVITRDDIIVECNQTFAKMTNGGSKPLQGQRLSSFLASGRTKDGSIACEGNLGVSEKRCPVEILARVIEYRGQLSTVTAVRDISERVETNLRLQRLSQRDPLTGLVNRREFDRDFTSTLENASGSAVVAVLALDLDRFKLVNDLYGHEEGDRVLKLVADIFQRCVGPRELVARLGGDEFCIVLKEVGDRERVALTANKILQAFETEFRESVTCSTLGVSIGVAFYPEHGKTVRELRNNADTALYEAKNAGRSRISFFQPVMDYKIKLKRKLERDLRSVAQTDQLFLEYQPVNHSDGVISGYEALLRWQHPERGVLYPSAFLRVAEETGAIVPIGLWSLKAACMEAREWGTEQYISVNLSPEQLRMPGFHSHVLSILNETGLSPQRLTLEVTEVALLHNRYDVDLTLQHLRRAGIKIALDDFGNGYSSLTTLRSFPFDKLKIDRSFVSKIIEDRAMESLFDLIMKLAASLSLPVVVEGVETEEQLALVAKRRPQELQGYLLGKPERSPASTNKRRRTA